jgi:tryptophan synthase alpha chain
MNRIDQKFKDLKKKKAFIAFITAGDPNLKITEELVYAFERNGVDIVELGVPFSDPLADGPTIQASSQRSLKKGTNLNKILDTVNRIRQRSQIPIALMTYYNPIFRYGEDKFIRDALKYGVDGVIIPDLPPEEAGNFTRTAKKSGLATVFFLAPTTTRQRMKRIIYAATGFVYYVSLTGVTGAHKSFSNKNTSNIRSAKRMTNKPICVGFGVSTPTQVRSVAQMADGVIVGSAIVNQIEKNRGKKNLVKNVSRFVWSLSKGLK